MHRPLGLPRSVLRGLPQGVFGVRHPLCQGRLARAAQERPKRPSTGGVWGPTPPMPGSRAARSLQRWRLRVASVSCRLSAQPGPQGLPPTIVIGGGPGSLPKQVRVPFARCEGWCRAQGPRKGPLLAAAQEVSWRVTLALAGPLRPLLRLSLPSRHLQRVA